MPPYKPTIPKTIVSMNTLDKDVVIKGSVTFAQQLVLEGTVEGEINSAGSITVGETALVKGTIKTGSAIVFGKVEGNIIVQTRCEVKPTAIVLGDITASGLKLEEGATFLGRSRIGKSAAAPQPLLSKA